MVCICTRCQLSKFTFNINIKTSRKVSPVLHSTILTSNKLQNSTRHALLRHFLFWHTATGSCQLRYRSENGMASRLNFAENKVPITFLGSRHSDRAAWAIGNRTVIILGLIRFISSTPWTKTKLTYCKTISAQHKHILHLCHMLRVTTEIERQNSGCTCKDYKTNGYNDHVLAVCCAVQVMSGAKPQHLFVDSSGELHYPFLSQFCVLPWNSVPGHLHNFSWWAVWNNTKLQLGLFSVFSMTINKNY